MLRMNAIINKKDFFLFSCRQNGENRIAFPTAFSIISMLIKTIIKEKQKYLMNNQVRKRII